MNLAKKIVTGGILFSLALAPKVSYSKIFNKDSRRVLEKDISYLPFYARLPRPKNLEGYFNLNKFGKNENHSEEYSKRYKLDYDKDGVSNHRDRERNTPLGSEVDEFGISFRDSDDDGISDNKDDCPEDPGWPQYNGCPDTDEDGIPNNKDLCPYTQPDVIVNEYGCPLDSDEDGLTDDVDQCPTDYGPMEYMGCPEPPSVNWFKIEEEMNFKTSFVTDRYDISYQQEKDLDFWVNFLFENPNMNIRLLGYPDPKGTKDYNEFLTNQRLSEVEKYLIKKGIAKDRISCRKYGEVQGRTTNTSLDKKPRQEYKDVVAETYFILK